MSASSSSSSSPHSSSPSFSPMYSNPDTTDTERELQKIPPLSALTIRPSASNSQLHAIQTQGISSKEAGNVPLPSSSPKSSSSSSPPLVSLSLPPVSLSVSPEIKFLCFSLSRFSSTTRFLLLSSGIFVFFMLNSYVEEYIFRVLPDFRYGWYLTFFELTCFAAFAALERIIKQDHEGVLGHRAGYKYHMYVAVAMTASRGLTNVSLQYLNYPTQIIFKSMKLLTVMAGSLCLLQQTFHTMEYVSAFCLVASAALFSYGDYTVSRHQHTQEETPAEHMADEQAAAVLQIGLIIVILSLIADAFHGTTQDSLMRTHHASTLETMLYTNVFSSLFCLLIILAKGELLPALQYCVSHPVAYPLFILRAVIIYGGVLCFLLLVKHFGVVQATAITTIRKILSIMLSFIIFPKPYTHYYLYGIAAFISGVGCSLYVSRLQSVSSGLTAMDNSNKLVDVDDDDTEQVSRNQLIRFDPREVELEEVGLLHPDQESVPSSRADSPNVIVSASADGSTAAVEINGHK